MALSSRIRRTGALLVPRQIRARRENERRAAKEAVAEERRLAKTAQRRHDLLESAPDTRAFEYHGQERIGRVVGGFTAADAAAHNLELVTRALEQAEVSHFLVRGRSPLRHVVGVHRKQRKQFLDAMRDLYDSSAVHAAAPLRGGGVEGESAYVDGALDADVKSGLTIRFAEYLLSPAGRVMGGFEYGCDVEFWRDGETIAARDNADEILSKLRAVLPRQAMSGALVAPRRNRVCDLLPLEARTPATVRVRGREHPTYEPFTWRMVDDVDFPVDVVYTWVDGADPEHAAERARHDDAAVPALAGNRSRFVDRQELRYSLRSLHMYAPFVRHVYLVTDSQVPDWLDPAAEGITVVDHRDIFDAPEALPTFNSHAIEARLHHIEGLAERYLYFNDDVFLAGPAHSEDFFHASGIARLPFSPFQLGVGPPLRDEVAPNSAGKNVRHLLHESFGRHITHKFKHVPHPQIREVMLELEKRYAEEAERTVRSRFRSPEDVAFAATLHHHYALLTGQAVPEEYRLRYIDVGGEDAAAELARLEEGEKVDFFCLNDLDTPPEAEERVSGMLRSFLEHRFPFPSPYEKPGA
ncbi:stealth conserved region 3 domain-containing protein [Nocardiopsis xinjiangensis]|uniref:stealth conserved region 3 domain-containing protein n=1 Tax=Nocardiopsis xinjiangensis TaxID=124285 RepID=UPI0003462108|nr:stealth conserved region 3 domain-containing protein [Nocardiopsis xinjiangensis]